MRRYGQVSEKTAEKQYFFLLKSKRKIRFQKNTKFMKRATAQAEFFEKAAILWGFDPLFFSVGYVDIRCPKCYSIYNRRKYVQHEDMFLI